MPDGRIGPAEGFLSQHRIAIVGASRDPKGFSSGILRELQKRGYDTVPVNPAAAEIGGLRCFARVQDVDPRPEAAFINVPAAAVEPALRDCIEAGVGHVWLFGVSGPRSIDQQLLDLCRDNGIDVVAGYCPYMFLPRAAWFHRLHGWITKRCTGYPEQAG